MPPYPEKNRDFLGEGGIKTGKKNFNKLKKKFYPKIYPFIY